MRHPGTGSMNGNVLRSMNGMLRLLTESAGNREHLTARPGGHAVRRVKLNQSVAVLPVLKNLGWQNSRRAFLPGGSFLQIHPAS